MSCPFSSARNLPGDLGPYLSLAVPTCRTGLECVLKSLPAQMSDLLTFKSMHQPE